MDIKKISEISNLVEKYNARLLPVVKDKNIDDIKKVYEFGYKEFGENRLDQLLEHKNELLDATFHFIAPLQSRKIVKILENCNSIHTLSRKKEAEIINDNYSNQTVFVQINIDKDPSKSGINPEEVDLFFNFFEDFNYFPTGIMCIPSLENDSKNAFSYMQKINEKLKKDYKYYNGELSMGMSNDWQEALEAGATWLRLGSSLFGSRSPLEKL